MPLPDIVLNEPKLQPGLGIYWKAFTDLSDSRTMGYQMGYIPRSEMYAYAQVNGLSQDQTIRLADIVSRLDNAYVAWHMKRDEDRRKAEASKSKRR